MRKTVTCAAVLLALVLPALHAQAQTPACQVVVTNDDGSFDVLVGGAPRLAITPEMAREALKARAGADGLRAEIEVYKKQIELLEKEKEHYEAVLAAHKEYQEGLRSTLDLYREQVKDYKKLNKDSTLVLHGAVGATGGDTEPALLVGVGIKRFRLSGLIQEKNSGVFLGVDLPLF
jgi:hypothetical protein